MSDFGILGVIACVAFVFMAFRCDRMHIQCDALLRENELLRNQLYVQGECLEEAWSKRVWHESDKERMG